MQFPQSWLRSLIDPALDTERLAHLLTMAGLEVEALTPVAAAFDRVVVARIVSAQRHPDADRLQVCQVEVGEGLPLTIVCGAANARPGLVTACARVGARLPGGLQIQPARVRGVESAGMLCSARELGLAAEAEGILELAEDAPPGTDLRAWLALDDTLITLKLTPNRGDCLSLLGIARELAALTGAPVAAPDCTPVAAQIDAAVAVSIAADAACPRYCGRVVRGIDPHARTPEWMVRRLERCGVRAIHPVVDVTNYVMLELGQPMHAFDLARLEGGLTVRYAQPGETLVLLDGQTLVLSSRSPGRPKNDLAPTGGGSDVFSEPGAQSLPNSLVIADARGPQALAGIMGGQGSAVGAHTSDILLEAAHFTPEAVAGRARAYGLHTDSAHRFERGVDPHLPVLALARATRLILELCGGQAGPLTIAGPGAAPRASIALRPERVRRLLGFELADAEMARLLQRLGMEVAAGQPSFRVTPPDYRFDLNREVDLIEEIARLHGYDAIPARPLHGVQVMLPATETVRPLSALKSLMVAKGYQEVVTYSFISDELDATFRVQGDPVPLLNPIASQMGVMRGSLMGGLLHALRHNLNHGQERVRIFEAGRVFVSHLHQPLRLGGLAYGSALPEQWGSARRALDFFDLRADVEALFAPRLAEFRAEPHPALHPGQCARVYLAQQAVGWVGVMHPAQVLHYGLARAPLLFELDLAALQARAVARHAPVAKHPAVRRDLAVVVDEAVRVGDMLALMRAQKPDLVTDISLFDLYQGGGMEPGKKSLAFKVLVQHTEKTLTDQEIDATLQGVLHILTTHFQASLRA